MKIYELLRNITKRGKYFYLKVRLRVVVLRGIENRIILTNLSHFKKNYDTNYTTGDNDKSFCIQNFFISLLTNLLSR
jgi:hypothetical protein